MQANAKAGLDTSEGDKKVKDYTDEVKGVDKVKGTAKVGADNSEEKKAVSDAKKDLQEYDESEYDTSITANAEDLELMLQAGAIKLEDFKGKNGVVTVEFEGDKYKFDTTDENIKKVLEDWRKKGPVTTTFDGDASILDYLLAQEKASLTDFEGKEGEVTVEFDGNTYKFDLGNKEVQAVLDKYRKGDKPC